MYCSALTKVLEPTEYLRRLLLAQPCRLFLKHQFFRDEQEDRIATKLPGLNECCLINVGKGAIGALIAERLKAFGSGNP